tara:strand:+ start:2406 stop:2636 length:231 start_codon:yes stop_codon:yes gene_type:complete
MAVFLFAATATTAAVVARKLDSWQLITFGVVPPAVHTNKPRALMQLRYAPLLTIKCHKFDGRRVRLWGWRSQYTQA